MAEKTRVAVIGIGNMGRNHVRTYSQMSEAELVGIADINQDLGRAMAEEFYTGYFPDFNELIEKARPKIVSICVPTRFHYVVAKQCLEKKINVLLEKPIASSVGEAEELLDLARRNGVKILVGHIERFNPAVKKVKEMIDRGDLGEITAIMARRVGGFPPQIQDANIAVDLAIHDIDLVNYILGVLPVSVTVNKQKNHIEQREDSVEFFLKYPRASAYIQANWITPVKIRKLNITGTEGYLEMDYVGQQIEFYKSNYEKLHEQIGSFSDYILRFSEPDKMVISVAKKEPLAEELRYFIACVRDDKNVNCQFAVDALRITLT